MIAPFDTFIIKYFCKVKKVIVIDIFLTSLSKIAKEEKLSYVSIDLMYKRILVTAHLINSLFCNYYNGIEICICAPLNVSPL